MAAIKQPTDRAYIDGVEFAACLGIEITPAKFQSRPHRIDKKFAGLVGKVRKKDDTLFEDGK